MYGVPPLPSVRSSLIIKRFHKRDFAGNYTKPTFVDTRMEKCIKMAIKRNAPHETERKKISQFTVGCEQFFHDHFTFCAHNGQYEISLFTHSFRMQYPFSYESNSYLLKRYSSQTRSLASIIKKYVNYSRKTELTFEYL